MKKLFTICLFSLLHLSISYSQCCPYLDNIYIIPENPTTVDSIYLVTNVTTPNQGSYLGYEIFELPDNNIEVEACYWEGFLTALQSFVDTINLGVKPAGMYTLDFLAISSIDDFACNPIDSNAVQLEFEVSGVNPTKDIADVSFFSCYPNPVTDNMLNIQSGQQIKELKILNVIGGTVLQKNNLIEKKFEIDMSELPNGIYLVRMLNFDNKSTTRKIIKR